MFLKLITLKNLTSPCLLLHLGIVGILDGLHSIIMRGQSKSAGAQTRETETAVLAIKNAAATSKVDIVCSEALSLALCQLRCICNSPLSPQPFSFLTLLMIPRDESQEAAYVMTQHENLLQAIKSLATGSVESTRNMAIGAINAFSRSQDAVPILIRANILMDVFLPIMRPKSTENDTSDEAMQRLLMTATRWPLCARPPPHLLMQVLSKHLAFAFCRHLLHMLVQVLFKNLTIFCRLPQRNIQHDVRSNK
jgi:hypothetical protein